MNRNKMFQNRTEALKTVNVKCVCSHSINITNRYKRVICSYCGRMVYLDDEEQKRSDFRVEMRRLLNGRNLY